MVQSASPSAACFLQFLLLFVTIQGTFGSGKVTVLLLNYANSDSELADGSCCDNLSWCVDDCDNFFRLCFAHTTSSDKCALWKGWTSVLGGDSFNFPGAGGSLGNGIMNPLTHSFISWQPIVFDVEVWDSDDGNIVGGDKDFVDRYSLTIRTSPSPNLASATAKRYKLDGPGSSYLNVEVKVFCDANYFVPDCATYCVARDDNTGHYTCDYTRGQIVCLSGWYGSDCLTYCMDRNDTLGHYRCDGNGQKQCLDNWFGQDCLVYCKPRNDSLGHYSCDGNGQKHCLVNWYGQDCLVYCKPRNGPFGHFSCDGNGQRHCLDNWYGNNCSIYCKPRNDTFGHYKCDGSGQKLCLDNWYGNNCSIYCKSRNDTLGHYTCDGNGQKQCLYNWYRHDCLVYCKSRNDTLGHYNCDGNGQKHCLDNWFGRDCLDYCKPRNDAQGHYKCNSSGHIDCLLGWRGINCTEENITSSRTNVSLTTTSSSLLVSTTLATRVTAPLISSSFNFWRHLSSYDVTYSSSLQSRGTLRTPRFSSSAKVSVALTSSIGGHYLTQRTEQPHVSSTLHTTTSKSVSLLGTPARVTTVISCPSDVSKSSFVSPSLDLQSSKLTASRKLSKAQTTEAMRITISSKLDKTTGSVSQRSLLSAAIPASAERTVAATLISRLSVTSSCSSDKGVTSQTTSQMAVSSTLLDSTLGLHMSLPRLTLPSRASNSQVEVTTLMSTSTIWLPCSTTDEITTKTIEAKKTTTPLTSKRSRLQEQTSSSKEFIRPTASSQQIATSLKFNPTVRPRCDPNEEDTTQSTDQPEEPSTIPGVLVQFEPFEDDQKLVVPLVARTIKTVLAEKLNKFCRQNSEACGSSEEEMLSSWFCPRDINIDIHEAMETGVSFQITSSLPPPMNGMVPPQTLMEVLKENKEDLESATQANIIWIQVTGSTTPPNYKTPNRLPDQLARVSPRPKTSPLPYIFGIAGAGLMLIIVLLVARAKLAKNRVQPCIDDEIPPSPTYECQADTIVLLSRTKGRYVCKDKENTGLYDDFDSHPPGVVEENNL